MTKESARDMNRASMSVVLAKLRDYCAVSIVLLKDVTLLCSRMA
jgi:hypothetical protein